MAFYLKFSENGTGGGVLFPGISFCPTSKGVCRSAFSSDWEIAKSVGGFAVGEYGLGCHGKECLRV